MYSQQQQQHSFSSSSPLFFSPSPNISKERVSETTMNGGHKTTPDDVEMTTTTKTEESGGMSGPLVRKHRRKSDIVQLFLRLVCLFSLGIAIAVMTTAEQKGNLQIYGFNLPIYSKWSFANSFEYLVGMAAAAAAHSLLQLIISGTKLLKKSHVVPSRKHAWLVFAGDQIFAYALMSAGSAASGVTNLNRAGIRHSKLPNFCNPLNRFCDHVAVSIVFTFFSCFLLATTTLLDVICLSRF